MNLYTIGEMSKITNISVRTLRYYDEIGIVIPEIRDKETNYRYYSSNQILQLQILKELRTLDFSLDEISRVIHNRDKDCIKHLKNLKNKFENKIDLFQNEIKELKLKAEAAHTAYNRITNGLNILTTYDNKPPKLYLNGNYENKIHQFPKTWVLCIRKNCPLNAEQLFLDRCMELQILLDKYNLYQAGGCIGIFHDGFKSQFFDEYGDLELCIPFFKPENFECKEQRILGSFLVASTIHIGHYKNAYNRYLSLIEWISQLGYKIVGPPIEFYLLEPSDSIDSEVFITRLSFPIKKDLSISSTIQHT